MRPSSDWPVCAITTRSSTVPLRSCPNSASQCGGNGSVEERNAAGTASQPRSSGSEAPSALTPGERDRSGLRVDFCTCLQPVFILSCRTAVTRLDQKGNIGVIARVRLEGPASKACEMPMNGLGKLVSGLFDLPATIAVERGVAEFRAGRPVVVVADRGVAAVALAALDPERRRSFIAAFASGPAAPLRLAITARRARALGI